MKKQHSKSLELTWERNPADCGLSCDMLCEADARTTWRGTSTSRLLRLITYLVTASKSVLQGKTCVQQDRMLDHA